MIKTRPDYDISSFKFNGGEVNITINGKYVLGECIAPKNIYSIAARIDSSDELMKLCLIADANKRIWCYSEVKPPHLHLIYLPYGRQDRVCNPGEAIGIKVFADIINTCGFRTVTLYDPHSDVATPLFNNVIVKDQLDIWKDYLDLLKKDFINREELVIVSPDHGAMKKSLKIGGYLRVPTYCANKIRDTLTGKILDIRLDTDNLEGKDILVFDDICDGGATFIELGNTMKKQNPRSMTLCITHGIFSKPDNIDILAELYNGGIYCYDSWVLNSKINSVFKW